MWAKLDDKLHSHRKPRKAGLEAMGLWAVCLSYCGDQLTDGWIPAWFVSTWAPGRKGIQLADHLVTAGLWERGELDGEKGWVFHDYLIYNKSREWVLADRAKTAKRQAEWREAHRDDDGSNGVTPDVSNAHPDPTRPDPTRNGGSSSLSSVALPTKSVTQQESGTSPAREARELPEESPPRACAEPGCTKPAKRTGKFCVQHHATRGEWAS